MVKPDERAVEPLLENVKQEDELTLAPVTKIKREPGTMGTSKFQLASELAT